MEYTPALQQSQQPVTSQFNTKSDTPVNKYNPNAQGPIKKGAHQLETDHRKPVTDLSLTHDNLELVSSVSTLMTPPAPDDNKELLSNSPLETSDIIKEPDAVIPKRKNNIDGTNVRNPPVPSTSDSNVTKPESRSKDYVKKGVIKSKKVALNFKDNLTKAVSHVQSHIKKGAHQSLTDDKKTVQDSQFFKTNLSSVLNTGMAVVNMEYPDAVDDKNRTSGLGTSGEDLTTNRGQPEKDSAINVNSACGSTDQDKATQLTSPPASQKVTNKESDVITLTNIGKSNDRKYQSISSHSSDRSTDQEEYYYDADEDTFYDANSLETVNNTVEGLKISNVSDNENDTDNKIRPQSTSCATNLKTTPEIPIFDKDSITYVEEVISEIKERESKNRNFFLLYTYALRSKWKLVHNSINYDISGIIYDDKGFSRIEYSGDTSREGCFFQIDAIIPEKSSKTKPKV